jgi:hypothetical protein
VGEVKGRRGRIKVMMAKRWLLRQNQKVGVSKGNFFL